jgi:hypothetical protein
MSSDVGGHELTMVRPLAVLLAGCSSSNGFRDVYLISLSYKDQAAVSNPSPSPLQVNADAATCFKSQVASSNNTTRQINIGYMSMCLRLKSGTWLCGNNALDMANDLKAESRGDPLNLVGIAHGIQTNNLFYGLT